MSNADPFVTGLFGGLPRMEIAPSSRFMSDITAPTSTKTAGNEPYLQALAKRLSSETKRRRQRLYGANSLTIADSKESTAPSSAMKARTSQVSLSDRLTASLIMLGLVRGITPMSIRQASGQPIRVFAFSRPDGTDVDSPKTASSSSNVKALNNG